MTRIFEDILGVDDIDPGASFGQIGGESLLAVRILSRCRRSLGVELPLRSLGPAVTLNQFIDAVLAGQREASAPAELARQEDTDVFAVPAGTAALVSLHELNAGSPLYSVAVKLVLTGPLDPGRLRAAVAALVQRHDALRLTFCFAAGSISARIKADPVIDYEEIDGSGSGGYHDADRTRHLIRGITREPLDLTRSPLRVRLVRESTDCHHLVLVVHHAVCDGLSLRILLRDLTVLYRDGTGGALPLLEAGVAELARYESARLTPARRDALADRWSARLAGAPELLLLPVENGRPSRQSLSGKRIALSIPAALRGRLQGLAAEHGSSLFSVLSSALAIMLHHCTSQTDIVIGIAVSGRLDSASQDAVANLARMVPLRLFVDDGVKAADLLSRAQDALMTAHEDADLPFAAIVQAVRHRRTLSYHPVFQVALTLLTGADEFAEIPGLNIVRQDLDTGTTKFDMSWYFQESGDVLDGYVEYVGDLFSQALMERLSAHFLRILAALTEQPSDSSLAFDIGSSAPGTESRGRA